MRTLTVETGQASAFREVLRWNTDRSEGSRRAGIFGLFFLTSDASDQEDLVRRLI